MVGANLRFGSGFPSNTTITTLNTSIRVFQCHPGGSTEAALMFTLGALGVAANLTLMIVILTNRQLRRWSHGLLFHQGAVDCARAALLLPMATSILNCQPVERCSLVETAFLLLVTVATFNMLTTVLNDSPIFPDQEDQDDNYDIYEAPLLLDSPQCVLFGTFMIWFASITINLGPTFLSGALAAQGTIHGTPSCPLIHGPLRHYVLNVLWIGINLVCVFLICFHLRKLHKDLTKANLEAVRVAGLMTALVNMQSSQNGGPIAQQRKMQQYFHRMEIEGVQRVKMFLVITAAYILFWGPLFFVTLVKHPLVANQLGYEITLHISYIHAIVNPSLFLVLHKGLRKATKILCCGWLPQRIEIAVVAPPTTIPPPPTPVVTAHKLPPPAQANSSMVVKYYMETPI